jgi:hypothetical protein
VSLALTTVGCGLQTSSRKERRTTTPAPEQQPQPQPNTDELNTLRAENEKLKQDLEAALAAQSTLQQDLSAERAKLVDSEAKVAASTEQLNQTYDALAKAQAELKDIETLLNSTTTSHAELSAELTKAQAKVEAINALIASKEAELATARSEVEASISRVESIERKRKYLEAFVAPLLAPLQGLWQADLDVGLNTERACKAFYQVDQLTIQRVVVCQDNDTKVYRASRESGTFVDLFKQFGNRELITSLDPHRQVAVRVDTPACANGFPQATHSLSWSAGFSDSLDVNLASNGNAELTLMRGDNGRGTATCQQILARPNRAGLGEAVFACQIFALNAEQIATNPNLGCFSQSESQLLWTATVGVQ